jgi:glycosyltransferase involved in cell wall biosynthesis
MAQAAVTIMTYDGPEVLYRDSVSNKFFDSMAAGKPVVANFSGFSTLVAKSRGAGIILSRTDVVAAARQLADTVYDDAFLDAAESSCRSLAHDVFNREKLARDLERVLSEAVGESEPRDAHAQIGNEFRALWTQAKNFSND